MHLDTLDRERFKHITRRDDLEKVLEGIELCRQPRLRSHQDQRGGGEESGGAGHCALARFARERDIEIRYIEFMPLDAQGTLGPRSRADHGHDDRHAPREIGPLEEIPDADPRAPATEYRFNDGIGRVGFIASVSQPFCLNCNRLRLTSDGKLRYCLFAIEEDRREGAAALERAGCGIVARCGAAWPTSGSGTRSTRRSSWRRRGRCIPSAGNSPQFSVGSRSA